MICREGRGRQALPKPTRNKSGVSPVHRPVARDAELKRIQHAPDLFFFRPSARHGVQRRPVLGSLAQGREFVWTNADFSRVQALIYQRAGISLHDGKHAMVYSRLSRRLRETGHTSFHEYLSWLENHDGPEWQEFVNALTTNLTAFFREQHHFEILSGLLRSRPSGPWSVWCNAASTGKSLTRS